MKNLSLFVSAFALCASTSYAAINCGTLPSCASLGYSDTVSQCPKSSTGADMVVKCPFDTTQGKCIHEAAVGQIAYFSKKPDAASGWLLCDGQTITKNKHPELYTFLGQQFCTEIHGGTCGTDVGRVPDYRGFFLRVAVPIKLSPEEAIKKYGNDWQKYFHSPSNFSVGQKFNDYSKTVNINLISPQKEGLPNITGYFAADDTVCGNNSNSLKIEGSFYKGSNIGLDFDSSGKSGGCKVEFDASKSNPIYGASSGVTPPNMAVYAYIYAGKIVQ